ncbi:MAG: hypothetical protein J0L92_10165 [Deltaproteobacteria bacterium]|nr:hypothetical protein [Deltaproteobacteria bacterium]
MALWKTKPELRLYVPSPVRVGEAFSVRLEVVAREAVPIEWIDLTLEAVEGWAVGAGKNRVSRVHRYAKLVARVVGETELLGTSEYRATFEIPATQPPSSQGGAAYVRYVLHAQASIPWWPDARVSWPLAVRARGQAAAAAPVVVQSSASEILDISLESQRVSATGIVGGLLALKKPTDTPLVVDVTLREILRLFSWNGYERVRHGRGFTTSVTLSPAAGGQAPFRFRFEDAAPTFAAETFRHEWELVVAPRHGSLFAAMANVFQGSSVHVPIEMVESDELARLSERLVAPSVGDARLSEIVASVAAERPRWGVDGLRLERTEESAFGPIDARIEWVSREAGTYLRAVIEPPRLGLGLRVRSAAMLDRLLGDTTVGVAEWDGKHHVETREGVQAVALLTPIALASTQLAMTANDDAIELERRDETIDRRSLLAFLDEVDAVLAEVPGALSAVPPPAGTSIDRTEATRLARLTRGTFHPGDLALRGAIDERAFEASLIFEGTRAVALRVVVLNVPAGSLHVGPGRDEDTLRSVPQVSRAMVAALPPGLTISIDEGRAQAVLPAPSTPLFGVDHAQSMSLATTLVSLARSLSPDAGPFR